MPSAVASTDSVNSSREPVRATIVSSHGTTRGPSRIAMAAKAPTLSSVMTTVATSAMLLSSAAWPPPSAPSMVAKAGRSTSASTIVRSSVISQPTATRPCGALSRLRSSSAFRTTTVLATDRLSPNTRPVPAPQPQAMHSSVP